MKKSIRLYISGTVQGMFFRGFVKGFVRNLDDGRVEIFLEGDNKDVEKMVELCKKGPKHAEIRSIEFKEERFQDFKTFKILHI